LRYAEGHIRGIQRMVENQAYCIDIIQQIQAVRAALNKVSVKILDHHLHTCLTEAVRGGEPSEKEKVLQEIVDLYQIATRV